MNALLVFFSLFVGGVAAWAFYSRRDTEEQLRCEPLEPGRKTYLVEPLMLPLYILVALGMGLVVPSLFHLDSRGVFRLVAGQLGLLFLHISAYYALLLLLLPLLRRVVSARACATLWLIPTFLYVMTYQENLQRTALAALPLPRRLLLPALGLWALGFAGMMGWQALSHLALRRRLRREGRPVTDEAVLGLWRRLCRYHGVKRDIPLLVWPEVGTPMTVGCFERTMVLALPRVSYSPREQELIFRHELRHIIRCDSRTKVFLGFCAAMCWFNPLGWMACRRAAEDLELSCDEAVLEGADETTRKEYARLLLNSAGTGRGYTTCLSAAAGSLRYRLRRVMKPGRRLAGSLAVGAGIFTLFVTFGSVALADSPASAQSLIFDRAPGALRLEKVGVKHWYGSRGDSRWGYEYDAQRLTEYLSSLTLRPVYVGSFEEEEGPELFLIYEDGTEEGKASEWWVWISLYDGWLTANLPHDDAGDLTYQVEGEVDWAYLDSLLDLDAPNPDPTYYAPELEYQVTGPEEEQKGTWTQELWEAKLHASRQVLSITDADGTRVPEYEYSGIGGTFGQTYTQAQLEFSVPPVDGYTVTVERWDGSGFYTLSGEELEGNVLPLAPYSAHYTVRGEFAVGDALYDMEFYFDIGQEADEEVWDSF